MLFALFKIESAMAKSLPTHTNKKAVFPKKYGFLNITINSDYSSEPV
ncbi:hypothetical protein HMPREF1051_2946 [Neisseria sicca VK64]|uniref:Uncharacterized protein n=1 Tax=Neisseria sicca VK64 TaxID=1095748 RepID=I2NVN7_NEISI|nr:hypothetical protein HMPREF1051_2946 [Neisseria sicca VK64]